MSQGHPLSTMQESMFGHFSLAENALPEAWELSGTSTHALKALIVCLAKTVAVRAIEVRSLSNRAFDSLVRFSSASAATNLLHAVDGSVPAGEATWGERRHHGQDWTLFRKELTTQGGERLELVMLPDQPWVHSHRRFEEQVAPFIPVIMGMIDDQNERRRQSLVAQNLRQSLDYMDVGVVLLDQGGDIMFSNSAALDLFSKGDGLRSNGRVVSAVNLEDALRLRVAIEHVVNAGSGGPSTEIVAIKRERQRSLLVSITSFGTHETAKGNAAAMLYILDPSLDLTGRMEPVCRVYNLTPVEARLAIAIASGRCVTDAASVIGVKEQTARTYLKQVFAKTNTNRQAELVRVMLSASVRIRVKLI